MAASSLLDGPGPSRGVRPGDPRYVFFFANRRYSVSVISGSDGVTLGTVNELFVHTQPAHLQKRHPATGLASGPNSQKKLENAERNMSRASYLRERLAC